MRTRTNHADGFTMTSPGKSSLFFLANILIVVGALLTLENLGIIHGAAIHWPIFLLMLGIGFITLFFQRLRNDEVLLWLGSCLLLLGAFAYYLNYTSWLQLETLWPFFLGIIGISFLIVGLVTRNTLLSYFAVVFISLFLILTLVFVISLKLWPMSLLVFGVCLLVLEHMYAKKER